MVRLSLRIFLAMAGASLMAMLVFGKPAEKMIKDDLETAEQYYFGGLNYGGWDGYRGGGGGWGGNPWGGAWGGGGGAYRTHHHHGGGGGGGFNNGWGWGGWGGGGHGGGGHGGHGGHGYYG